MEVQQAYDIWSEQYDTNENKTRDLEAKCLRELLAEFEFETCLEIGCGTGKNTAWLTEKAIHITAVDFSKEMLQKAKEKIKSKSVEFIQADIRKEWDFSQGGYDLVTFSLVLEHIQDLDGIFKKAAAALKTGGLMYVGELHPFKQYAGSKARFELNHETVTVNCFTHHIKEYFLATRASGFQMIKFDEHFDEGGDIPRLLVMAFRKAST